MAFHETQFPSDISYGSSGGPTRRTDIFTASSGHEHRNSLWADSRRTYDAGYGIKTLDQLDTVIRFFEERRGQLHGFRWKDWLDFKSTTPSDTISSTDQYIGTGNGINKTFRLQKIYGSAFSPYTRYITKPIDSTVLVSVNSTPTTAFTVDGTTGVVTMNTAPANGTIVKAGFEFDVPVRFNTDEIMASIDNFNFGQVPSIPVIEIRV